MIRTEKKIHSYKKIQKKEKLYKMKEIFVYIIFMKRKQRRRISEMRAYNPNHRTNAKEAMLLYDPGPKNIRPFLLP